MRFLDERCGEEPGQHHRPARGGLSGRWSLAAVCAALALLGGCAHGAGTAPAQMARAAPGMGPQADFPVIVGAPFVINGVAFTPRETLNYDEVGYVVAESATAGITGAHHTLPLPSYAEITSLDTGRTVLVRMERRGPMDSTDLVALSPAALAQLGAGDGAPVRVRRVIPPEDQRAMLRAGEAAPPRIDTPRSLLTVLRRNLPARPVGRSPGVPGVEAEFAAPAARGSGLGHGASDPTVGAGALPPLPLPAIEPAPAVITPAAIIPAAIEPAAIEPVPSSKAPPATAGRAPARASEPGASGQTSSAPARAPAPGALRFEVQAAAFSTQDRARRVAGALGGRVEPLGRLFRVRTGPFATRSEAEASLAKVRAAGYSDARILTSG